MRDQLTLVGSIARVGATIVVHEQDFQWASMDVATKFRAPRLSIKNRRHYPALFASLQQHDLATLVSADGSVQYLGVGLRSSTEAERNVDESRRRLSLSIKAAAAAAKAAEAPPPEEPEEEEAPKKAPRPRTTPLRGGLAQIPGADELQALSQRLKPNP